MRSTGGVGVSPAPRLKGNIDKRHFHLDGAQGAGETSSLLLGGVSKWRIEMG